MLLFTDLIQDSSDREKFYQIYEQYGALMYYIAYDVLKNEEDAKDAMQEAFVRIARNINKIDQVYCTKTKNYVAIICKNVAFNILGMEKKHILNMNKDYFDEVQSNSNPEKVYEKKQTMEIALKAIQELPEIYRDCLYLELVEEYSKQKIAMLLDLSLPAVQKRCQRGKRLLQKELRKKGVTYED